MKIYNSNPYRVLGIKANASAPEKQKVKNRIAAYIKVGKPPVLDFDLTPPLENIIRTQELIDLKSNEILSDEDKIKHALFWFVSGGIVDDIALSNLTEAKDIHKALSNFEKGTKGFTIDKNSICSIVNHSTLEIICYPQYKSRARLKSAIDQKLEIVSSDRYLSMLLGYLSPNHKTIASSTIQTEVVSKCKNLLIELFGSANKEKLFLEFFSNQKEITAEIKDKINKKTIDSIKNYLLLGERRLKNVLNDESGKKVLIKSSEIGNDILERCTPLLITIKESYGPDHNVTQNIYNDVFNQINSCSVSAGNMFIKQYNDSADQESFVLSAGKTCQNRIISLLNSCKTYLRDISIPIKHTINNNLEAMKAANEQWKELYDVISAQKKREEEKEIERKRQAQKRREQYERNRPKREREKKEREKKEREEIERRERKEKVEDLFEKSMYPVVIASAVCGVIIGGHLGGLVIGGGCGFGFMFILGLIINGK